MALTKTFRCGLTRLSRRGFYVDDPVTGPPYAGSYPASIAELDTWTLASPWTILYNFNAATVNPSALASAAPGSVTHGLIKWGADATATKAPAGQGGYLDQTGYTINTSTDFLLQTASAAWKYSATVPTCYLLTFKFGGTPSSGQVFLVGWDGLNGGWWLESHPTSGVRVRLGTGTTSVYTSYVGGTSWYDGEYHTLMLVIDDAAGKVKIISDVGNVESTGLTISTTDAICSIGPWGTGGAWASTITYLLVARGEDAALYTDAQAIFDAYEDARLNNANQ